MVRSEGNHHFYDHNRLWYTQPQPQSPTVVSEMSDLFRLSRFGDVKGCQTLFSTQQASPDDVNPIGGWTVPHVSATSLYLCDVLIDAQFAVDYGSVEFCRVLIQQGADAN